MVLVVSVIVFISPKTTVHTILSPAGIGVTLACLILLQRQHLHLAGAIFLGSLWLILTAAMFSLNGINNAAIYGYVVIIIFTNIIFARRRVVMLAILASVISTILLAVGETQGILPLETMTPILIDRFLIAVMVFVTTGILSSFSSHSLRRNLARLRQNEEMLQARNRELETLTQHLTASEERYRLLFENATIMAAVYDSEERILLVNEAFTHGIGQPRSAIEGHRIDEIFSPTDAKQLAEMNRQAFTTGEMAVLEVSRQLPNGQSVYYLRHTIPLPLSEGASEPQVLVLTTDLTGQKRAMERQQALQAAQEKLDFFSEFFDIVSHDLKSPLTVMHTNLYLLERAPDASARQQRINLIGQQIRVLDQYLQDMLMISKLEHIPTLQKVPVDVQALIAKVLYSFMPVIEQKALQCDVQQPMATVVMEADADQLQRALTNLIENAINYTLSDGRVTIKLARQPGGSTVIEVHDTGIGIPAEDLPHIFDRFYRSPNAKALLSSGSGLGLAIVKQIVELHGGTISVESSYQHGSCFRLVFDA